MADALMAAKDHPLFPGENGKKKSILESIKDMEAYSKLTDHVIWQIISSTEEKLEESRNLINRILNRDIYVCIGRTELKDFPKQIKEKDACKDIYLNFMAYWKAEKQQNSEEGKKPLEERDICVHIAEFDYGMNEKNPVENVKFYRKSDPDKAVHMRKIEQIAEFDYGMNEKNPVENVKFYRKSDPDKAVYMRKIEQYSMVLPRWFSEKILRVFSKKSDSGINQLIKKAFEKWCEDEGL